MGRPDTLCRQFLLVVSTEVEENDVNNEDQSVKLVKQLKKDLDEGFNLINQRLPKEDEKKEKPNHMGLNIDVMSTVETDVLKKGQSYYSGSER